MSAPAPLHRWTPVSGRKLHCAHCRLLATAKHDPIEQRSYTLWEWRNLQWDSRSSTTPTCPPTYGRQNGINPQTRGNP